MHRILEGYRGIRWNVSGNCRLSSVSSSCHSSRSLYARTLCYRIFSLFYVRVVIWSFVNVFGIHQSLSSQWQNEQKIENRFIWTNYNASVPIKIHDIQVLLQDGAHDYFYRIRGSKTKANRENLGYFSPSPPLLLVLFIRINAHGLVDQEGRQTTENGGTEEDP